MNTHKDEALVLAASKGNLDAFNQVVLNYQDLAYHHAYTLMGDSDSAEDVAQESFVKAFQALSSFRGGSFRSWLLRIVTNCAYDILRRSQRHPSQPLYPEDDNGEELESAPWLADPSASVQDAVEQAELSEEIRGLVEQLPETYRNVLTLVDIYQFDYSEAAETLRVPIGTVKSRLARARLQMKEMLKDVLDQTGEFQSAFAHYGQTDAYFSEERANEQQISHPTNAHTKLRDDVHDMGNRMFIR